MHDIIHLFPTESFLQVLTTYDDTTRSPTSTISMNRSTQSYIVPITCEAPVQAECRVATWIWFIVSPVLLLIGLVGNITVIFVLSRKKLRSLSTIVYLLFLAVADITFSTTAIMRQFVIKSTGYDVLNLSRFNCVMHRWVTYTSSTLSPWLLVLLTIERTYVTLSTARVQLSRKKAIVACASLLLLVSVYTGYLLFAFDLQVVEETSTDANGTTNTSFECLPRTAALGDFFTTRWNTIVFVINNIIPLLIIVSGNTTILIKLIRQRATFRGADQSSTRDQTLNAATRTVLIVSLFFLITTIPYTSFSVVIVTYYKDPTDIKTVARIQLAFSMIEMLLLSNYTFNFLLYFLSGTLFREELKAMVAEMRMSCSGCISRLTRPCRAQ